MNPTHTRARTAVLIAAAALTVVAVSACSRLGAAPAAQDKAAPGTELVLTAKQVDKLGQVVTDGTGMTLYRFEKDTSSPSASNCEASCAALWPPLTTTATRAQLNGIDKRLIGTMARKDGSVQITLKGMPLYRYAKDGAPGDAKGQGVGGTWYAITPTGDKAAGTATGAADTGTGGSGY
jgi:predicted lipoprotein with Yx(FWY)xxD motif